MKLFNRLYLNIGAMKAGTTWLFWQLEQHPDLVFSREKELHYNAYMNGDRKSLSLRYRLSRFKSALDLHNSNRFTREYAELLWWYCAYLIPPRSNAWYRKRFPEVLNDQQYCCDFSNLSSVMGDEAWSNVRDLTEILKVSYILRHPIDRLWSNIKFMRNQGLIPVQLEALSSKELLHLDRKHDLWRHSQYSISIETLTRNVDHRDIKIMYYSDIENRPKELIDEIELFLGIERHNYISEKIVGKVNVSQGPDCPDVFYKVFEAKLEKELASLQRLGINIPNTWQS